MLHIVAEKIKFKDKNARADANNPNEVKMSVCNTIAPFFVLNPWRTWGIKA